MATDRADKILGQLNQTLSQNNFCFKAQRADADDRSLRLLRILGEQDPWCLGETLIRSISTPCFLFR